jgi:hypothetical protein
MTTLTSKREEFARLVAGGRSAASAYRTVYPGASVKTAETAGPALARKDQVRIRVGEFQRAAAQIAEEDYGVQKEQVIRYLLDIVTTPIGEVDEKHHLCERYMSRPDRGGVYRSIRMPSKLKALIQLAKLCGFYKQGRRFYEQEDSASTNILTNLPALEEFGKLLTNFPESKAAMLAGLSSTSD